MYWGKAVLIVGNSSVPPVEYCGVGGAQFNLQCSTDPEVTKLISAYPIYILPLEVDILVWPEND